jgi:hypothetical protein
VFASKTCRLEAALGVGSSHVYWFEGCQKSAVDPQIQNNFKKRYQM